MVMRGPVSRPARVLLVGLLLVALALAGCAGGDDPKLDPADPQGETRGDPQTPGGLEGRIVDHATEPVADALVAVFHEVEFLTETTSDDEGRFRLEDLAPGEYAVRVQADCCREEIVWMDVEPDETAELNVVVEPLQGSDVKTPHVKQFEWQGFIGCSQNAVFLSVVSSCSDPNHENRHDFVVEGGVRSVSAAMEWDDDQVLQSHEYEIRLENSDVRHDCPGIGSTATCPYRYMTVQGGSPLVLVANESVDEPEARWSALEVGEEWTLQFVVWPRDDVTLVYQQPFTVHYHVHYWEEAAEDYNPLDGVSE